VKLELLSRELNLPAYTVFAMDLSDEARVNEVAGLLHAEAGAMDIIINASGLGIIKPLEQLSLQEFNLSLQTNLTGAFLLAKAFLPQIETGGQRAFHQYSGRLGKSSHVWRVCLFCQQPESGVVSEMVLQPFNHQAI
jgi:NAD(P)-dependent dehydrogenase (short-subunit alcohol dehydrogenase family)